MAANTSSLDYKEDKSSNFEDSMEFNDYLDDDDDVFGENKDSKFDKSLKVS